MHRLELRERVADTRDRLFESKRQDHDLHELVDCQRDVRVSGNGCQRGVLRPCHALPEVHAKASLRA
jgi:hypothetical protein